MKFHEYSGLSVAIAICKKRENTISTLPVVVEFSASSTTACKVTEFPWSTTAAIPFFS